MTCGSVVSPGQRIEEQADEKMPGDQKPSPADSAVLGPKMGDSERHSALLEISGADNKDKFGWECQTSEKNVA